MQPGSRVEREVSRAVHTGVLKVQNMSLTSVPRSVPQCLSLTVLDMSSNGLKTLPESLCTLPCLQELHVNWCELSALPENIGRLKNLRKLACGFNQLSSLPEDICSLPVLEALFVNDNSLGKLPRNIGRVLSLREIAVQYNQITELPNSVGQLEFLRDFNLRGNPLQNPSLAVVMEGAKSIVAHMKSSAAAHIQVADDRKPLRHPGNPAPAQANISTRQHSSAPETVSSTPQQHDSNFGQMHVGTSMDGRVSSQPLLSRSSSGNVAANAPSNNTQSVSSSGASSPQRPTQEPRIVQPHHCFRQVLTDMHLPASPNTLSIQGRNPVSSPGSSSPTQRARGTVASVESPSRPAASPPPTERRRHSSRSPARPSPSRQIHWPQRSSSDNNVDEENDIVLTNVLIDRNPALLQNLHDLNIVGEEDDVGSDPEETHHPLPENTKVKMPDSVNAPKAFLCPILHDVMVDPVLAADGHTYERPAIERWFKKSSVSPMTGQRVKSRDVLPNFTIKSMIQEWIDAENSKKGSG